MIFVDPFGRAFCFPPRKTVIGIRTNLGPESPFFPAPKTPFGFRYYRKNEQEMMGIGFPEPRGSEYGPVGWG